MYGPVRTVVWEGRSREAPPYPDRSDFVRWHKASIGSVRAYVCSWGCTGNGRATVKLALLTQLGNENKYYGTDQLGSAIFLAHALLPRDEI